MDRELFTLMSRVHVIMRFQEKKDVDLAHLQANADYAREILDICAHSSNAELVHLGAKLNERLFGADGVFGLPEEAATALAATDADKKYIRSLR